LGRGRLKKNTGSRHGGCGKKKSQGKGHHTKAITTKEGTISKYRGLVRTQETIRKKFARKKETQKKGGELDPTNAEREGN